MAKQKANKQPTQAELADRHELYQQSVQDVESEIDFVEETFLELRGRPGKHLREDFCGTANTSCEWIRRGDDHTAVSVDIDKEVLDWGREHNLAALDEDAQKRISLIQDDVAKVKTEPVDMLLAMNFSYWMFETRDSLRAYFERCRETLVDDGILFLDAFGGYEAFQELEEPRECDGFDYIWDQDDYDPMSGHMKCFIHFEFEDGSRMDKAFAYEWRLWTLPEIRELLEEAGYSHVGIYLEGDDDDGEGGNGIFSQAERGDADAGWLAYIVAQK